MNPIPSLANIQKQKPCTHTLYESDGTTCTKTTLRVDHMDSSRAYCQFIQSKKTTLLEVNL